MKGKNKLLALLLGVVMLLSCCMMAACGDGGGGGSDDDGYRPVPAVRSVAIQYNGSNVEGELSLDISVGKLDLTPVVSADEGAQYTLAWSSSDPNVATVTGQNDAAAVTLNGTGETVLKAEAGAKTAQFVLTVSDSTPETRYTITVSGGVAKNSDGETISKAAPGTQVQLEATIPEHQELTSWALDKQDVSLNGYSFIMPASDVTATATFATARYPLTLVGATVQKAGSEEPEGTPNGYSGAVKTVETQILNYEIPYGEEVTIKAVEPLAGKCFVAWDYAVKDNRVGDLGIDEYTFTMDDDNAVYTAVFSNFTTKVWRSAGPLNQVQDIYDTGSGAGVITDGGGDRDLQGLNGYTLSIRGGTRASDAWPENIAGDGSVMDTRRGRAMGKAIFKNHGTATVTLEAYATYCGILVTTGEVTVKPDEVVVKYFDMSVGLQNPWWGVVVREDVEGSDVNRVDMVLGMAVTEYPDGDPYLAFAPEAKILKYADGTAGASWNARPDFTVNLFQDDRDKGIFQFCGWGVRFGVDDANRWYRVRIANLPAYDAENPKVVVYGRCINNANNRTDPIQHYNIVLGTDPNDPNNSSVKYDFTITSIGQVVTWKLEIDRSAGQNDFYLFIVKPELEDESATYGYAMIVNFTYNNVFGYEEV